MAEASRIIAKATRGYYAGNETFKTAQEAEVSPQGFAIGFGESGAWRTFPHPERKPAMQGAGIKLAGPNGEANTSPIIDADCIAFNGASPDDYETFWLDRAPECPDYQKRDAKKEGIVNSCKTEYRAYDPVVVSILFIATQVAPDAIKVSSDGGQTVFRLMF